MSPAQLPLDLSHEPAIGIDDFVATSAHKDAYEHVMRFQDWSMPVSLLVGDKGAGKTHLARLFAHHADAVWLSPDALGVEAAHQQPLVLELDDNPQLDEEALFHALNRWIHGTPSAVLITATGLPATWGLSLPDLISRLRLVPHVTIGAPDDHALRQILVKQIQDRQLMIDPDVIEYVLSRMERSFAAASQTIERLDYIGLAKQRRITKRLAGEVLHQEG